MSYCVDTNELSSYIDKRFKILESKIDYQLENIQSQLNNCKYNVDYIHDRVNILKNSIMSNLEDSTIVEHMNNNTQKSSFTEYLNIANIAHVSCILFVAYLIM